MEEEHTQPDYRLSVVTIKQQEEGKERAMVMFLPEEDNEDEAMAGALRESFPGAEVAVTRASGLLPRHVAMLKEAVARGARAESAIRRAKNMRGEVKRMTVAIDRRNKMLQDKMRHIAGLEQELAQVKAHLHGTPVRPKNLHILAEGACHEG